MKKGDNLPKFSDYFCDKWERRDKSFLCWERLIYNVK